MSSNDSQGKVAVITGAGMGFGREFALLAARRGMRLVLADIQRDALNATLVDVQELGAEAVTQVVDVADGDQVEALAVTAQQRYGVVHTVFNNAGVGCGGLIWENTRRDWEWTLGVNLWGVIHGVRAFVPRMLEAAQADPAYRGHVVNTASMAGLINPPLTGVYNASKHAVVSLSETLHHDLALVTQQVRCSVLCPYYVPTGIHASHRNRPASRANDRSATQSQRVAHAMIEKAVTSGKVSAADVARMTFEAIDEGRFYIVSHPQSLASVQQRAEDIAALRDPTDPLGARDGLRESLIESLRR
ncbi:SDR family oxidoreductase [Tahibacter harae]|uniref:SDR family oxidoreductase n=1 Tax=Tahibacter harae TaxID=2963937 RepID=A0ABT1QM52_9GAMM|nr:SDR family oxidoreductase [Tahibacter harae]MCQ4163614.1 SDR family oxidoreductase [Tahibacter harae]